MAISQSLRSRSISLDAEVARSRSGRSGDERRVVESVDQAELMQAIKRGRVKAANF